MKVSKRSRKLEVKDIIALDAGVWGQLQDHIQLQNVYQKLPSEDLFRLRVVCKAWNDAAKQRLEPKPFFVIIAEGAYDCGDTEYLNGVLSYDVASKKYSFKRQRFPISYTDTAAFDVEGLIFCDHPDNLEQQGVFNIHNKTWHAVPPAPKESEYRSAIGMMVDTSERPYSFKLVVGSLDTKTQIYDSQSRSWTTTSSRLKQLAKPAMSNRQIVNCMCNNGCVYISIGAEILLIYSMERDTWTIMDFPEVKLNDEEGFGVHALGAWEGRIFTTREDCRKRNVTVWELVDPTREEWEKYVIISGANYDMLNECDFAHYGPSIYMELRLLPCYCDGYLLLYNWHYHGCQSYALGMLNLATHEWEEVKFPSRTVAFEKVIGDSETEDDFETEEEGSDMEGGSEKRSGFDKDSEENRECFEEDSEEEDDEDDEGTESEDSEPGCAPQVIRIRRKACRTKVKFQRHKGRDIVHSKNAHSQQARDREFQLAMIQSSSVKMAMKPTLPATLAAKAGNPSTTIGKMVMKPTLPAILAAIAGNPSATIGKMVMKPTLPAILAAKAGNPSATIGKMVMKPPLAPKVAKPSPAIVLKPTFECAMCFFESDCPDKFEAHKKTKVHGIVQELRNRKKQRNPLSMLHDYISHSRLLVNYECKHDEVIAIVGPPASRGTGGPHVKGFGRHSKRKKAKQMAAADVLERIIENDSESEFVNFLHKICVANWRAFLGDRNDGGNSGSGIGVDGGKEGNLASNGGSGIGGKEGNLGGNGGSSFSVGAGEGNPGDSGTSGKGVSEEFGGNSGGNVGSNRGVKGVSEELGGNSGGNVNNACDVGGGGGHSDDSGSSGKGVGVGGGNPGGNCEGIGGGGSNPSNPNLIPVTGCRNHSSHAGSLSNDVDKKAGQDGSSHKISWQVGHGETPTSRPAIDNERKLEKLTESYLERIQGGRGYGGRESFGGAVGVGGNSYGFQDVDGIGYVGREPASFALSHGSRGLHPRISGYGHQSQGSLAPHNVGQTQYLPMQNHSIQSGSQQVPMQYISTLHVQTQHALHTQQITPWISTVGGPGQGRTPYSIYDMAPQSTGVSTGMGQTAPHTYNHQLTNYAPSPIHYSAYQEYVVNTAVPVQEMAPGTSTSTQSALVAQYGVMQQVPQQRAGYSLQGAIQHQQP